MMRKITYIILAVFIFSLIPSCGDHIKKARSRKLTKLVQEEYSKSQFVFQILDPDRGTYELRVYRDFKSMDFDVYRFDFRDLRELTKHTNETLSKNAKELYGRYEETLEKYRRGQL